LTSWETISFSRLTQPHGGVCAYIRVSCNNRNNWVCNPGLDPKHETLFTINCNDCCSIIHLLLAGSDLCFIVYVFFQNYLLSKWI